MITNNLINSKRQSTYPGYVAPPNYVFGSGDSLSGQLDMGINGVFPAQIGTDTNWSVISATQINSYGIRNNGTIWSWGGNMLSGLGLNISTIGNHRSSPTQIGTDTNWSSLAINSNQAYHIFAIKTNGTLWAWGNGAGGALGDGTTVSKSSPIQIGALTDWAIVSAGDSSTMAIKTDGTLWTWGLNNIGQLGDGTVVSKSSPIQIGSLSDWAYVACGSSYSMAVKTDGTLWSWGRNTAGQLGLGDTTARSSPTQVGTLTDWLYVACGFQHTVAVKTNGTVWTWGSNSVGQLGYSGFSNISSPTQVGTLTNWSKVRAGNSRCYVIKTDGSLWAWGDNSLISGPGLGDGTFVFKSSPIQVGSSRNWSDSPGGNVHSLGLTSSGTIWSWGGRVDFENIGLEYAAALGRTVVYSSPIQISTISNISMVSHEASTVHIIKKDGTLWSWGDNTNGQVGNNSTTATITSPIQIGVGTNWLKVSSGLGHTIAIKTDGTLWAWGLNSSGQLGDGTTDNKSSPIQIGSLTNWSEISCGSDYTMAVRSDGTLWAWGTNTVGKLGIGNTTSQSSPTQVAGTTWRKVFSGSGHTLATRTDGTLWAWGSDNRGQLGANFGFGSRSSPVQVSGGYTDWSDAACGVEASIAVRSNGTIWSWGRETNGVLGRGTFVSGTSVPAQIGSLTNWKNIYLSKTSRTALAIKTDGTLWTWGRNNRGQLGRGTVTTSGTAADVSSPVQVGSLSGWVSGSSGIDATLFLQS